MGLVVGLVCEDGVVIGSDSSCPNSATDAPEPYRSVQKTHVIGGDVVLGSIGNVGIAQRFVRVVRELREDSRFAEWDQFVIARSLAADARNEFQATQTNLTGFAALVGFRCATGVHLCELQAGDLQPEFKGMDAWFTALGPGRATANSLLGLLHRTIFQARRLSLPEGVFATVWALDHACRLHPGWIHRPFHTAVLAAQVEDRPHPAWLLSAEELTYWLDQVRQIEQQLETLPLGKWRV